MYENIKQIIIKLWEIVENIVEFILRVLGSIWRLVLKILGIFSSHNGYYATNKKPYF